jgi:asparagine synthase (glutamine-hydrolysing)
VGYNWINQLIAYCASQVTDEQLAGAIEFPYNPQSLKRRILPTVFNKHYPQVSAAQTVRKWIPKWQENQSKRKSK